MPVLPQGVMLPSNSGNTENTFQQIIPYQHYIVSESLLSGLREDGKMSLTRSFFCLFVTFDLLFTMLLWFISVVVRGGDIYQSLSNEVCNYSVHTSLFDVVMCAALRFTVLLLIYGLLYMSHLFVIFWTSSSQPMLQAIIIMSSFVIAWIELWFMGLQVLPQEQYAKKYLTINPLTTERTPLLSSQTSVDASDSSSQLFYSPIVTPEGSVIGVSDEDEDVLKITTQEIKEYYVTGLQVSTTTGDEHISSSSSAENYTSVKISTETSTVNNTGTMEIDYVQKGREFLEMATKILNTGEWVFERRTEDGDSLFSRQLDNGDIVYRLTAVIDLPAHDLMVILYHDLENYPKWNPTLLECRVIQKIDETTDISYQVTSPGARGCVASRDFITLRHWKMKDNTYIVASASIDYPGVPVNTDYIRGHSGPGCWELQPLSSSPEKTEFRWLLNTKLNGWIPLYIADKAFKKFMAKYMSFLRSYCVKVKAHNMSNTTELSTSQNITS